MKKNRLLALGLAGALTLGLLAGCGGKPSAPGSATGGDKSNSGAKHAGGVELTVVTSYGGDDGNRSNYENAVASYGKNYAVPSSGFWENMFVNTKVLADCGVSVPGPDYTWDQFLADCETIKAKGYAPIACSLFEVPHYWFEFCIMNNGTLGEQLAIPGSATDAVGQKWAAGLNDIKDLYEKG